MSRFSAPLEKVESTLGWNYHIKVPPEIAEQYIQGDNRRVICLLNDSISIHCALMPAGSGEWFIFMNKSLRSKLKLNVGSEVFVSLEKDQSEYGTEMPIELEELLNQDEDGAFYFHQLTPGKQRSLIYLVSKVKNTNSRLNKALAIVHHLKEMQGKLDFKILMQTIKEYNNR